MAHYAQIENGVVTQVIVAHSKAWCVDALGGEWVQTSYNTRGNQHPEGRPLNKNYAGIGFSWDGVGFAAPKCHDEATLNQETYLWDCTNPDHTPKEIN
jgi:hypothetical protein